MPQNRNWRVVAFSSICFFMYLFFSIINFTLDEQWGTFSKVNLISDIFKKQEKKTREKNTAILKTSPKTVEIGAKNPELYSKPNFITNFETAAQSTALENFSTKLLQLSETKKGKIRIAYFGDSMIEGDLLTKTLRKLLQQKYGGNGVGFLPMHTDVAGNRTTAKIESDGWETQNFKEKNAKNSYISGFSFSGLGSGTYTDLLVKNGVQLSKKIIYGASNDQALISYNNQNIVLSGPNLVNTTLLSNDATTRFSIKNQTENLAFYGVSFESENGIILDNFSFRGITGVEFKNIDEKFLKAVQTANHYDLIIFQYGVNLLYKPNNTEYSNYEKSMNPILDKFKKAFPDADFLLVSSADRAFLYDGIYKSAIGLPNLLKTQAQLAFDHHISFFNLFETMGGENSIVDWATKTPPLANKDYIHPNEKGADLLAEKLFQAINANYNLVMKSKVQKK